MGETTGERGVTRYVYVRPHGRGRRTWHYVSEDGDHTLCGHLPSDAWILQTKPIGRLCRRCRKRMLDAEDKDHPDRNQLSAARVR